MTGIRILRAIALVFVLAICLQLRVGAENTEILILKEEKPAPEDSPTDRDTLPEAEGQPATTQGFVFFYERWHAFEMAYAEGDTEKELKLLHDMLNWRQLQSIPTLPEFAVSLVQMGNSELAHKNKEEALRLYGAATDLDPSYAPAYYAKAHVYFGMGLGKMIPGIRATLDGISAPLTTAGGQIQFWSKYALILTASLVLAAFFFALVLLLKYNRLLRHDAHEKIVAMQSSFLDAVLWGVLFIPVLLLLGPLWLAPFWIMIFFGYARGSEKILAVFFLVVFILAFPVYRRTVQYALAASDPKISPFITAFSQGASPKAIHDLEKYYADNPQDTDATILLAYLYKIDRATISARETLQRYVVNHPGDARAYNNMANISFIRGETDSALRFAQRAAELDSGSAIYQYNLSKLQRAKFNFSEAERYMDGARRLDPVLVQNLEGSPQEKLIDAIPNYGLVWQRINQRNGDFASLLKNPFSLAGIGFLILTLFFYFQRNTLAACCDKCGKPFCRKCHSNPIKNYNYCSQCLHIFVKKDGVSPISRKQKMKEIEEHNRRDGIFARVLSLVVPGTGSLFQGRAFFGTILLLVWLFVLVMLLFSYMFGNLSYYEPPQTFGVIAPICVFFLAILYVIANITNFRITHP